MHTNVFTKTGIEALWATDVVYLMRSESFDNRYKIGISCNVHLRLNTIRKAGIADVELIHFIVPGEGETVRSLEQYWHLRFWKKHAPGNPYGGASKAGMSEWFRLSAEDVEMFTGGAINAQG